MSTENITVDQKPIPIFCMDEQTRDNLCFKERFDIYAKNNILASELPIGSLKISIEKTGPTKQEFLVHAFSSIKFDNCVKGGSNLISLLNRDFSCLEEKRTEFLRTHEGLYEKNLYLSIKSNEAFLKVMSKSPWDEDENYKHIVLQNSKFVSDGCNIILKRHLAKMKFNGKLTFDSITNHGELVKCIYECCDYKLEKSTDMSLGVHMINQKICEAENVIQESKNILTRQGKILSIDFACTTQTMKINSSLDKLINNKNLVIIPFKQKWKEDIEIKSKYLEKKVLQMEKLKTYWSLHSQMNSVIADYVQMLLNSKPNDILTFTLDYFKIPNSKKMQDSTEIRSTTSEYKFINVMLPLYENVL